MCVPCVWFAFLLFNNFYQFFSGQCAEVSHFIIQVCVMFTENTIAAKSAVIALLGNQSAPNKIILGENNRKNTRKGLDNVNWKKYQQQQRPQQRQRRNQHTCHIILSTLRWHKHSIFVYHPTFNSCTSTIIPQVYTIFFTVNENVSFHAQYTVC